MITKDIKLYLASNYTDCLKSVSELSRSDNDKILVKDERELYCFDDITEALYPQNTPESADAVRMSIDDDMQEDSFLHVIGKNGEEDLFTATVHYANGSGHEDEECMIQVDNDSVYEDDEIEDFVKELIGYVENELNPFIEQLQELEDAVKEGGPEPVADFPCEECGKYGVSILESFYPIGKCCYCGNENEVHVCALCGTVFNEWGGDEDICNGCMIDEERNEIE